MSQESSELSLKHAIEWLRMEWGIVPDPVNYAKAVRKADAGECVGVADLLRCPGSGAFAPFDVSSHKCPKCGQVKLVQKNATVPEHGHPASWWIENYPGLVRTESR